MNNASLFEKEQVQEELAGNFDARETVTSGYLRFDQKLTKDVELMTGLRIENTNLAYTGRTYDADEDLTSQEPTVSATATSTSCRRCSPSGM